MLSQKLLLTDLSRILRFLPAPMRWKIYGLFLLMFLVAIFEVLAILSMSFTAMSVAAPQVLLNDPHMLRVFAMFPKLAAICADPRWFTCLASLGVVLLTIVKNALTALLFWKQSLIGEQVSQLAGDAIMEHYLNSSFMWHITGDSQQTIMALGARQSLSQLLMQILTVYTYAGTFVALVLILVSATPAVILGILGLTGLICFVIYQSMKKALDRCGDISLQSAAQENKTRDDAMRGIREVLIYNQQQTFREKFREACGLGAKARAFLGMAPPIPTWILEVYGFAAIPFTTWVLIRFYNADMALITGVVTMVMLCSWRILPILNRSLSSLVLVRSCRPMAMLCLERLEKIKKENRHPLPAPDPDFRFQGEIRLEHVNFRYPGSGTLALSDIVCDIPQGMQVGLVGLSGSGKSTLAGVIAGLLEPESGSLLVDGKNPDPASMSSYRSRIGFVAQAPYLMRGSIAENVAFSQWGKPYDAKLVRDACAMAALEVAFENPAGIEYQLGENGSGLSGGQAQRVAIARSLYARPDILIFDESTSALDQHTEGAIMETINSLKNRLTMIIIAHRLSTVEQCDRIIWLEQGRIVMIGSPDEVLPKYRRRCASSNTEKTI